MENLSTFLLPFYFHDYKYYFTYQKYLAYVTSFPIFVLHTVLSNRLHKLTFPVLIIQGL